jgi:hypothetical protein
LVRQEIPMQLTEQDCEFGATFEVNKHG